MEGRKFIETIRLDNILSYGPSEKAFDLEPLNVLIGPNTSGKSNLIEALSILAAAPRDLQAPIREGGGVGEWLWKGTTPPPTATIDVTLKHSGFPSKGIPLRYRLSFTGSFLPFHIVDEVVEDERPMAPSGTKPYFYYRYQNGDPVINLLTVKDGRLERPLPSEEVRFGQSVLSQRRDFFSYPELTYLANQFERMSFYREWNLGRHTPPRRPQQTDLQQDRLLEDASNLNLVLSDLMNQPPIKEQILERMRDFYPSFKDVRTHLVGGNMVQLFIEEEGLRHSVPATRLSDGSLRYLCLLAVLCHPNPPEIVCIEEPELGLHPDIIPEVAKLLVEASSRCQLFVTTHSDILVDALTDVPEAVVVCEKVNGATQLHRLDGETLKPWLEKYRLGELWTSGELGGNRW